MECKSPTPPAGPASITDLLMFRPRWRIRYEPNLEVWSADWRSPDGRHRRFAADRDPGQLVGRLAAIESEGGW